MKTEHKDKIKNIGFFLIFICLLISLSYLFKIYEKRGDKTIKSGLRAQGKRFEIDGLNYTDFVKGKEIFYIKADSLRIKKKRIGFFRTSLFKDAILRNVKIRFNLDYFKDYQNSKEKRKEDKRCTKDYLIHRLSDNLGSHLSPLFKDKKISKIVMRPIKVEIIYNTGPGITTIEASMAQINLKRSTLLFKGNIKIEAGPKLIQCNQSIMDLYTFRLKIGKGYTIRSLKDIKKGNGYLFTDIFLRDFD